MLNNNYKNEAMNLMDQIKKAEETRLAMIKEAQETLVILGAESVVSTVEVQNVITINKGKIVKLTKEVEIDNTDYTTIEMLRQTIKDMNNNYDVLLNDYNELETKLVKALNRIAELEQAAVVVEEPVVEETKETIDPYLYMLDAWHISEEDRKVTNNSNTIVMEHALKPIVEAFNSLPKEEQNKEQLEILMNKKNLGFRISGAMRQIRQLKEERRQQITASYKPMKAEEGYVYGLQGTITIEEKEYTFVFTNSHYYPVLYGCFDKMIIGKAYSYLTKTSEWKNLKNNDERNDIREENKIYDFDNKMFIYKSDENIFKGYIDKYAFVWNTKEAIPCGTPVKNALNNNYRKMNESWGNGFVARAQMIKDACRKHFPECFNVTNDIKTTKEAITNTNDEIDPDDLLE